MSGSWDIEHDMTQFFLILDHFLPLYPLTTQNQNFEKRKKTPGDNIILP